MKEKKELTPLPCPFCGYEAYVRKEGAGFVVTCPDLGRSICNVLVQTLQLSTKEAAIKAWNKRHNRHYAP